VIPYVFIVCTATATNTAAAATTTTITITTTTYQIANFVQKVLEKLLVAKIFVKISNLPFVEPQVAWPMPWLRRLIAGLSPRRSGFGPILIHLLFVMEKMTL